MSEHTKEPCIRGSGVNTNGGFSKIIIDDMETDPRHVAAAVKACAGIPTDALESFNGGIGIGGIAMERLHTDIAALAKQRDDLLELAKLVRKELVAFADDLKTCSTIGGEWDGTEAEAKEEYDRLMGLAAKLAEKVEAAQ